MMGALEKVAPAFPRSAIEQAVESLIALLDTMDGDPDIEDDGEDLSVEDLGLDDYATADRGKYLIDQTMGPIMAETGAPDPDFAEYSPWRW